MVIRKEDLLDGSSVTDSSTTDSWVMLTPATRSLADQGYDDEAPTLDSATHTDPSPAHHGAEVASIQLLSPDQHAAVRTYIEDLKCVDSRNKDNTTPEIWIRALMLGDYNVGMSVLPCRYMLDIWLDEIDPIKYEGPGWILTKMLKDRQIRLEMLVERPDPHWSVKTWPTGVPQLYAKGRHCEACILMYDVTCRASFEGVKTFYRNFCQGRSQASSHCPECTTMCPPRPPFQGLVFVFANKIDCDSTEWQVPLQEGRELAASIGQLAEFVAMSVKTGEGCRSPDIQEIIKRILSRRLEDPAFYEGRASRAERRLQSYGMPATRPLHPYYDSQLYWY